MLIIPAQCSVHNPNRRKYGGRKRKSTNCGIWRVFRCGNRIVHWITWKTDEEGQTKMIDKIIHEINICIYLLRSCYSMYLICVWFYVLQLICNKFSCKTKPNLMLVCCTYIRTWSHCCHGWLHFQWITRSTITWSVVTFSYLFVPYFINIYACACT